MPLIQLYSDPDTPGQSPLDLRGLCVAYSDHDHAVATWRELRQQYDALPAPRITAPSAAVVRSFGKRVWTDEDVTLLRKLRAASVSPDEIAIRLRVGRSRLFEKMRELELTRIASPGAEDMAPHRI